MPDAAIRGPTHASSSPVGIAGSARAPANGVRTAINATPSATRHARRLITSREFTTASEESASHPWPQRFRLRTGDPWPPPLRSSVMGSEASSRRTAAESHETVSGLSSVGRS